MVDFKLPSEGLTILHDQPILKESTSKELPQIIQLNLVENVTKDILKSIRNNEQVRLKWGKKPAVQYGKTNLNLSETSDTFTSGVFMGPIDGTAPVYFSGKMSHTMEVQRAKKATAGTDEALAALENTLKSMKEQQACNEASFMGSKNEPKKRPNPLSGRDLLRGTTTPSSPYLGASPRLGPSSNSLLSSIPTKEKIRQDAMKIPVVHLLAMGPMSPKAIAKNLSASQADCDKVLEKVARDSSGGNKELKDKWFKELDVWKFPYRTQEDRDAAINTAIHAFDRLRIAKDDNLWQLLLRKEERGKGKTLSRLNFEPRPAPVATPKLGMDNEGKTDGSDKEVKAKKPKSSTDAKDPSHKKKLSGDTTTKKAKVEKAPTKPATQPHKSEGKFKSSERIEDSDEEAKGVEVVPAKPKALKSKERDSKTATPRTTSAVQANGHPKSKLSSSSISNRDRDLDTSRAHEDRTKLKPRTKPEPSQSASRISPRPRVDSSPQKPSPLGSSPPTNSTDLENSSKSSTQSSAPSSPPSSTDMPMSQTRNYSPVIAGKGRNMSNLPKRKGEKGEEPPAKRQQVHGLGLPKTLTEKLQQTTPERRPSDSSVSSPEKSTVTKESILDATLKFREYYEKYESLHIRLNHLEPDQRSDRELDQLWKMHERLEKIKTDLWADWDKVAGE